MVRSSISTLCLMFQVWCVRTIVHAFAPVISLSRPPGGLVESWGESIGGGRTVPSPLWLSSGGTGLGMGVASKSKSGKGKKKSKGKKKTGASTSTTPSFDVNASLLRHEKRFEELEKECQGTVFKQEEDDLISESDRLSSDYVIAARSSSSSSSSSRRAGTKGTSTALRDWVPVAQLLVARSVKDVRESEGIRSDERVLSAAVSSLCREISQLASLQAPIFSTVARSNMEYAVETMDSFHTHVYSNVKGPDGGAYGDDDDSSMTKADARQVLELGDAVLDVRDMKTSYRKKMFELHPDRFVGVDRTDDEIETANRKLARVKLAFETLCNGSGRRGSSWYESLGGKARTDFIAPVSLVSIDDARATLDSSKVEAVIVGLDAELVQDFVLRNSGV